MPGGTNGLARRDEKKNLMDDSIRGDLRAYYDKSAGERDERGIEDWKARERAAFLALIQSEGKRTLLEIGAGPGRDGKFFQEAGLEVTCVDLSPEMVARCRAKGLNALVMDMAHLDFAEESFDAVYSMNSLLHIPKAEFEGVLRSVERILHPGGLFFIGKYGGIEREGVWENDPHEPKRFFAFYTDEQLLEKAGAVFAVAAFRRVVIDPEDELHFQSLTARKGEGNRARDVQ